ncbi:MAG: beta-lactamase family protein [Desulfobacteraceae bacterium]|nr:beta-lactamase family protein [Desulfobacteraceae bacterium]MBC2755435.1 beta-lactamase family protein [Desulfobacteraceae bacterium]
MTLIDSLKSKVFRTISVPDDLSLLTTRDSLSEAEPADAAMTSEGVDAIWSSVEDLYRSGIFPGISFCLRRKGRVVINRAIGHSHGNGPQDKPDTQKVLMTPDTPVCQYSASKAVTAMMIHFLAEQKALSLDDPVKKFVPEFAANKKHEITIHHLISHHGGIPTPPADVDPEILYDHEGLVKLICGLKPTSKNGGSMAYHAVTGGVIMGEIVRRVTGKNIRELLRETIQEPLGFRYFNYGVPDDEIHKVAVNYDTGLPLVFPLSTIAKRALSVSWGDVVRISNEPRFMQVIIPAANLVASADEMSQFYQMLLNGGELNGKRIFKSSTICRVVAPVSKMWFDGTMVIPMRYSEGLMLGASPVGMWGPYSESAYGHIGFINIFCWADPARDISVSLQTTGKSLIGTHIGPLARFLFTVGRHCSMKGDPGDELGSFASFKAPFQKMLRKMMIGV